MPTTSKNLSARQERIYNFLRQNPVGVMSTVDPDGNPHGVVVYYAIKDDFIIQILTKTGTRKYDNLIHNNHVSLTVFEPRYETTVQIHGRAVERAGSGNINAVAGAIFGATARTGKSSLPPIVKLQAGAFTTFQIEPVQIRMAIYARPESGDYDQLFDSIESFDFKPES